MEQVKKKSIFVIHKHHAKKLHYDFRLKIGAVLKSWVIPKGLAKKIGEKRLAILVEDHALSYKDFEGIIPKGQYGAGKVEIYDKGKYENLRKNKNQKPISMRTCFKEGKIKIKLEGKKIKGKYVLYHFRENDWLIFKMAKKEE